MLLIDKVFGIFISISSATDVVGAEQPNTYIPISAAMSYVMGSSHRVMNEMPNIASTKPSTTKSSSKLSGSLTQSVNVQFRILELDESNDFACLAVKRIELLGGMVAGFSAVALMAAVLLPALRLVSSVSKQALDLDASPDKVVCVDMDFLLAHRTRIRQGDATACKYLRHNNYYFLSEAVEGQLYVSATKD